MQRAEAVVFLAMQLAIVVQAIRTLRDMAEQIGFLFFQGFLLCVNVFLGLVVWGVFGPRPHLQYWMLLPVALGFGSLLWSLKPPKRKVIAAPAKAVVQAPARDDVKEEEKAELAL